MALSKTRKQILLLFLLPNLLLLVISLVYGHVTEEAMAAGEEAVSCVFKHNMHLYCPGCGGSRSLVYLLNLDLINSFVFYPALPVSLLFIIDIDLRALISFLKNDPRPLNSFNTKSLIIIPVVIILTFIVRNVALVAFGIDLLGDIL